MTKTFALLFLLCSVGLFAQQKMQDKPRNILPELKESVNDSEGLMTEVQRQELGNVINGIGNAKVVVYTTPDAGFYETFPDFLTDVCTKNHFDAPGSRYVLVAVSRNLMEIRILCSPELRDRLSDAVVQNLIDNVMIPEFKEEHYFEGITKAVWAIQKQL